MTLSVARGSLVALVTPFDAKGRVDFESLEQLVSWHIEQGTDGLVCCGSTGEGIVLSDTEKKRVVAACVAASRKKIQIIACSGSADTRKSVLLTEQMQKIGAAASLVVTPYYNQPTQRGCVSHFSEIANVGLPIILYNNPCRATLQLSLETIAELARLPAVVAIKEASSDMGWIRKLRKISPIPILSGDDHLTHQTLAEGGAGAISVIGNVIPRAWKKMISLALEGKIEASKAIADRSESLCKALFLETNPQCVKFAVHLLGKCRKDPRLPLLPPIPKTQEQIKAALLEWHNKIKIIDGCF